MVSNRANRLRYSVNLLFSMQKWKRYSAISIEHERYMNLQLTSHCWICQRFVRIMAHFLRDVPWEDIFKLSASAAASEFCEWVQVGIDVYIPHRKYQVKPHSSPRCLAACGAVLVYRNHFFHLYQQNKSSESKVKFRQANNRCCQTCIYY